MSAPACALRPVWFRQPLGVAGEHAGSEGTPGRSGGGAIFTVAGELLVWGAAGWPEALGWRRSYPAPRATSRHASGGSPRRMCLNTANIKHSAKQPGSLWIIRVRPGWRVDGHHDRPEIGQYRPLIDGLWVWENQDLQWFVASTVSIARDS